MPERQIIQGDTFIAVSSELSIRDREHGRIRHRANQELSLDTVPIPVSALIPSFWLPKQTPFQQELERTNTTIEFSRYPDGSLRLFPPGSIVGDAPAGYSQESVVVKIRVYNNNPRDGYVVIIPTTRTELDRPGTEEKLAAAAYNWSK